MSRGALGGFWEMRWLVLVQEVVMWGSEQVLGDFSGI